jgi:DNA-binding NarL/FixJ family response regulator
LIRVLLVEDQALVRRGVADLINLTPDLRVTAEAEDGEQALERLRRYDYDVALMDVMLPKLTAVDVLERLRAEGTAFAPVLLLTTFDDDDLLMRGLRAGARGYLLKAVSFEDLAEAIRALALGETRILPAVTGRARNLLRAAPAPACAPVLPEPLTRRESEILRLMAGGFSNKEIAGALVMSEGTVRNHGSVVFAKLGVRDRTRAVLKALELGLI